MGQELVQEAWQRDCGIAAAPTEKGTLGECIGLWKERNGGVDLGESQTCNDADRLGGQADRAAGLVGQL